MREGARIILRVIALVLAATAQPAIAQTGPANILHLARSSSGDLEIGGDLSGLPHGSTRYIRYDDLLRMPQETYTVSDDTNFHGKTEIAGVPLETLARQLGSAPNDSMIVAICYDQYRANYPRDYIAAHHPILVLRINGRPHDQWPPSPYGDPLSPYLISHPTFKPAFKILSHQDEPQIPYGVTRIEVRRESVVFGAIRPNGNWPANSPVGEGYAIARQDCFRCHNSGAEGGAKAGRSWTQLAKDAMSDPGKFQKAIRNPASVRTNAQMPAHSDYDDSTLAALTAYFKTFALPERNR
jgi:hypothetical protein